MHASSMYYFLCWKLGMSTIRQRCVRSLQVLPQALLPLQEAAFEHLLKAFHVYVDFTVSTEGGGAH